MVDNELETFTIVKTLLRLRNAHTTVDGRRVNNSLCSYEMVDRASNWVGWVSMAGMYLGVSSWQSSEELL